MRPGDRYDCLYCLQPDSYEVRLDKRGRPYMTCIACGARTFLRGAHSLRGPQMLWGPLTLALEDGEEETAKELVTEAVRKAQSA